MNHVARMPGRFNDRSMALMGIPDLPESAFGGDLPPFQRTALVRMMGIKPQGGGGGGGLMKVVAVVAAIAIPFAAPVIASSIGLSAGIAAATSFSAATSAAIGSAIVGAGLGAVSASVTGGNVGRGALMGAIGGGIGGYTSVPASASGSPSAYSLSPNTSGTATGLSMPSATTPSLAGSPSLGSNLSFTPDYSLSAGMTPSGVGMGGTGTGLVYGGGGYGLNPAEAGLTLGGTTQSGLSAGLSSQPTNPYSLSGMSSTAGAPTAAADPYSLANTSYAGPGSNLPYSSQYGNLSPTDYSVSGVAATPSTAGLNTAGASEFGLKATTASAGGLGNAAAATTAGTTAATTAEKLTFTQALAKVPEALQAKFTDPKALADLTMRAGAQLLTGQLSDAGLSNEEKQLLQARVEEMKQNKEINNELFQTQLREAYDLLGRSDYFDPGYFGQQYAGAAKQRTSAQKEAALRKVNPRNKGSRAALERQYNLQSAREEATAYDKGSMYGFDAGLKLTQQALNALPKSAPTSSADASALSTAYGNIEERKRKSQEGLNKTLGPLFT
jgi:osmotically inducible lipoprotein OsmB